MPQFSQSAALSQALAENWKIDSALIFPAARTDYRR
jgi:hypothetical protein